MKTSRLVLYFSCASAFTQFAWRIRTTACAIPVSLFPISPETRHRQKISHACAEGLLLDTQWAQSGMRTSSPCANTASVFVVCKHGCKQAYIGIIYKTCKHVRRVLRDWIYTCSHKYVFTVSYLHVSAMCHVSICSDTLKTECVYWRMYKLVGLLNFVLS